MGFLGGGSAWSGAIFMKAVLALSESVWALEVPKAPYSFLLLLPVRRWSWYDINMVMA